MAMGSLASTTVALVPSQMVMSQKKNMILFQNVKWSLEKATFENGRLGVRMTVVMKRKITGEMMTTFFPTLLLTAITFATTFFKPFFFEAALSVNLTTMLVMTTIFISKMEGLPPTSDIKMIDIWLVLCQMVPFSEVILLTAMEYYRKDKIEEKAKKKKRTKKKSKKKKLSKPISINILSETDIQQQRDDNDLEQRGGHSLQTIIKDNGGDNTEGKCWIPDLKTAGRCI